MWLYEFLVNVVLSSYADCLCVNVGLRQCTQKIPIVINLSKNGKRPQQKFFLHRFIWEQANGPIPQGMQIDHLNRNKSDNRLENLDLKTPSEHGRKTFRTVYINNDPCWK